MALHVALGELSGNEVVIRGEEQASQIYNKGFFGDPQPGGSMKLDLIEAIYLMESEKLEIIKDERNVGLKEMISLANRMQPNFEINYLVYRDLRQRGYVVKPNIEPMDFRVFPRGGGPNMTPTKYWVIAISERAIFDLSSLSKQLDDVLRMKKQLLLAVVDEESDLTYYLVRKIVPKGKFKDKLPKTLAQGLFLRDRVLVLDEKEAAALHAKLYYGKMVGNRLQLSLLETAYLLEKGILEVLNVGTGRKIGLKRFMRDVSKLQPDFKLRLAVYKDLKRKNIIVKTGFKYGSHFRIYENSPENHHAKYLVHAFPHSFTGMWPEVSRAVRLAHGVKKDILFGGVNRGNVTEYIRLQRMKP
ncbi:MAG: tRNA-intron lyase [Thermoplasmata archaeon]|nr:tRNA-intron lyase [Thermoplasmata archaeon]